MRPTRRTKSTFLIGALMPKPKSPTAEQVKAARLQSGLSAEKAAAVIMVSGRQWQKYEAGKAKMHPILWRWFCLKFDLIEEQP